MQTAIAQPAAPDTSSRVHPNAVPYESDRSILYHVLATPAYVLHGATRPIGWTVKYLERNYPGLFKPKPRRRGVLPLAELGGPVGITGGVALYDNHLFGSRHKGRLEAVIGARNFFELEARYAVTEPAGPGTDFSLEGNFFSEPRDRFFIGGIESDEQADGARFAREQVDVTTRLQVQRSAWGAAAELRYEHVEARPASEDASVGLRTAPGFTTVDLITPRAELTLDFTRDAPRTSAGTQLLLGVDYTHDLHGQRFRYGRYAAAVQQFVPVTFFPPGRRLVFRARIEQVEPILGGEAVPFYHLPRLGGQRSLRGFLSDRFQDEGSLLLTAEYRYPIWTNLYPGFTGVDAVFFVDTGQVFDTVRAVAAQDFKVSVGGGLHLINRQGLSARFEVARSVEGTQVILTVRPALDYLSR
jgi:outer membrane protein assembly factor BamA